MGSPDFSDSCMIALYPSRKAARSLAVDGGLARDDLHLTVAYIGPAADTDPDRLNAIVEALAARPPITAGISGHARFTGGEQDVAVALTDSPDLETLRRDATDALANAGITIPRDHGYTPHITTTYLAPDDPAPYERLPASDITFTALSVVHGTHRTDHPLGQDATLATAAREAYAAGWAASGGPMTERVRAGCAAAVAAAHDRPHDPHVLEVTVDLGRLEGMWALLFHRREEQQKIHTRSVAAAWAGLFDEDTVRALVQQVRAGRGLAEADTSDDHSVQTLATAAAGAMLRALGDYGRWDGLRQALRDAIKAGRAEGMVNAVAIAAEQADTYGLDWDAAFADAYSLERLDDAWADTSPWLARLVARTAAHLSRILSGLAAEDASTEDMVHAAHDVFTDPDSSDVAFTVDWAMTDAADNGALALYQAQGAPQLSVITAGDGRVCADCQNAEGGSPYPADEAPVLPIHPLCRCTYAADVDLGAFASWFL